MTEKLNIYQKLIEVRKAVSYLKKEKQGSQYSYVGSSQVLGAIRNALDEQGLLLIPKVTDKNILTETIEFIDDYKGQKKPKKTTTYFTELTMEFTWVNAENPDEIIVCPWYGQGVDIAGEKGVGKAMTYAEKYFMLKFFNIATDKDDPDAFQHKNDSDNGKHNKPSNSKDKTPTEDKPTDSNLISEPQAKRAFALSGGRKELVTQILAKRGYTGLKQVPKGEYDSLCKEIEISAMELQEQGATADA